MAVWGPNAEPRDVLEPLPEALPRPPERWWDLFLVPIISIALTLGLVALAVWFDARTAREDVLSGSFPSRGLETSPLFLFASMGVLYLAMLGAAAMLLFLRGHRLRPVFFPRGAGRVAWVAVPAGMALAVAVMGLLSLLPPEMQQELAEQNAALDPSTLGEALAIFVIAVLLAPLAEELYFRGLMLRVFSRGISFAAAAVVTAALFSLVHGHLFLSPGLGGWLLTGIIFVLGLLLALFARAGRSLRAPFFLHAAYNATLVIPSIVELLADDRMQASFLT